MLQAKGAFRSRNARWLLVGAFVLAALGLSRPSLAQGEVDLDSGRLFLGESDWSEPAGPIRLDLVRTLHNHGTISGLMGLHWRSPWERRLSFLGDVALVERAGAPLLLSKEEESGQYVSSHGHRLTLKADGTARMSQPDAGQDTFDSEGRLLSTADRNGNALTFIHGDGGRLERVEGPHESSALLAYNQAGLLAEVTFSSGRVITYRYEAERLVEVLSNGRPRARYGYDIAGRLSQYADGGTQSVTFAYDEDGRVLRREWADGSFETFAYNDKRNQVKHVDANGALTTINWSEDRRTKRVTNHSGQTSEFRYDEAGRLVEMIEPDGRVSKMVYDEHNRVISLDGGSGVEQRIAYLDDTHLVKSVEISDGYVETYHYDEKANLIGVSQDGKALSSFEYGPKGELLAAKVGARSRRELTYDAMGRLNSLRLGDDPPTRFEYDRNGNLVRQIDPLGGLITRTYDTDNRLTSRTDQAGATTRYEYNSEGRRVAVVNALGGVTRYSYDDLGRLVETIDPLGRILKTEGAPDQNLVMVTHLNGLTEQQRYDVEGRLVEHIDTAGLATRYAYDQDGRLTAEHRPGNHTIRYLYDEAGGLAAIEDSQIGATRYERGKDGLLLAMTGPDGKTVRYSYDKQGRLSQEAYDNGATVTYNYTESGQVAEVRASDGSLLTYSYDEEGRVLSSTENGETTSYVYDPAGRVTSETHSTLGITQYGYDAVGNLTEQSLPDGRTFRYEYDLLGRRTAASNPLGRTTHYLYDAIGNTTAIVSPSGETTLYAYDRLGRLSEIRHPANGSTTLVYDDLGRIVETVDSLGYRSTKSYDKFGNVTASGTEEGGVVTFDYDDKLRVRELRWSDGRNTRYAFNKNGLINSIDDSLYPIEYDYDDEGRLTEIYHPEIDRSVTYRYDQEGRLQNMAAGTDASLGYRYAEEGRLSAIQLPDGTELEFSYDDRGRLRELTYPNGVKGRWTFDDSGRVKMLSYTAPNGQDLTGWAYRYDAADFPIGVKRSGNVNRTYRYDPDGRLISEKRGETSVRYDYAPGGNRAKLTRAEGAIDYRYDEAGRLLEAGGISFKYDAAGRLVQRDSTVGRHEFAYDAQGKLTRISTADGDVLAFGYGPTGKRVWRETRAGRSYFLYDGHNLIQELDADGRPRAFYVHGPGIDWPLAMLRDGQFRFFHADTLGNVVLVTGQTGREVASYDYDAFGNLLNKTGDFDSPFLFSGREFQRSVGLYFFRSRFYDPTIGRFVTPDPFPVALVDPASLNRYAYARNAPTRYRDPLGLYDIDYAHWRQYGITPDQIHAMVDSTMELLNRIPEQLSAGRGNTYSQTRPGPASQAVLNEAKALVEAELWRAEMGPSRNQTGPRLRARARAAITEALRPPPRPRAAPPPPNSESSRMAVPRTDPTGTPTQRHPVQGGRHTDIYQRPPPDQYQIPPPEPEPVRGTTRARTAVYDPMTRVQGRTPAGPTRSAHAVAPEPNPTVRGTPRAPRGTTLQPTLQQGATPPEPGSTGIGPKTRGASAAGLGMTGIAIWQHYQACLEEGGDPQSCKSQAQQTAVYAGGILVGGVLVAATSATVAGILASPVLVAAGTVAAGVAAVDATVRRGNAPGVAAVREQQEQAAINRRDRQDVIAQIDGLLRAQIDAFKALPAEIEQQEEAILAPVFAFEETYESARQERATLRDLRAQLLAAKDMCTRIKGLNRQMTDMVGDAAGYEEMVHLSLDVAQKVADKCPDVASPDNITSAYNQAEGALSSLGGVREAVNGLNAQVINDGNAARDLRSEAKSDGAVLADQILKLGAKAESLRDTIMTHVLEQVRAAAARRNDFETQKAQLRNQIDNFYIATGLSRLGPNGKFQEEVRAIELRPDRIGNWVSIRDEVENDYRKLLGIESETFNLRDELASEGCESEVAQAQSTANDVEFMFLNATVRLAEKQHLSTAAGSCIPPEQVAETSTGETDDKSESEDSPKSRDDGGDSAESSSDDASNEDTGDAGTEEAAGDEAEETSTAEGDIPCDVLDVNSPCYDPEEAADEHVRDAPECDESDPAGDCYSPWADPNAPGSAGGSDSGDVAGAMAAGDEFGGGIQDEADVGGGDGTDQVAAIPDSETNPGPGVLADGDGGGGVISLYPPQPPDDGGVSDMADPETFMPQPVPETRDKGGMDKKNPERAGTAPADDGGQMSPADACALKAQKTGRNCHIKPGTKKCHCPKPGESEAGGSQTAGIQPGSTAATGSGMKTLNCYDMCVDSCKNKGIMCLKGRGADPAEFCRKYSGASVRERGPNLIAINSCEQQIKSTSKSKP